MFLTAKQYKLKELLNRFCTPIKKTILAVNKYRFVNKTQNSLNSQILHNTIVNSLDYYSFGMLIPERNGGGDYRHSFQGQEANNEIKGKGNSVNYKYRMHDARVGRFFAVDPLTSKHPHNSVYAFSENRVIDGIELEGLEWNPTKDKKENIVNDGGTFTSDGVKKPKQIDVNGSNQAPLPVFPHLSNAKNKEASEIQLNLSQSKGVSSLDVSYRFYLLARYNELKIKNLHIENGNHQIRPASEPQPVHMANMTGQGFAIGFQVAEGGMFAYGVFNTSRGLLTYKTFYVVAGSDDATRYLYNYGIPWASSPTKSHFGTGIYTWGYKSDALAYRSILKVDNTQILKFRISNYKLNKFSTMNLTTVSDDVANSFLSKYSSLYEQGNISTYNYYNYIIRGTGNLGAEHFFKSSLIGKFRISNSGL